MVRFFFTQVQPSAPGPSETFLAHVPPERRRRFAEVADLDAALVQLVARARAAWPDLPLDPADFLAFLGRVLPEEEASGLARLQAADLWLVCAYGLGTDGAARALDQRCLGSVRETLERLAAPPTVDDVLQELRRRLLEIPHCRPDQKVYCGRGELVGWLRVSAVRELNLRKQRSARELDLASVPMAQGADDDPETLFLLETQRRELVLAFRDALGSMSSRERNVLRYHFVERLSIDQIGTLYHVHRATAARWIDRAREELCRRTWEALRHRMSMSEEGFQRALGLIQSQIGPHLALADA